MTKKINYNKRPQTATIGNVSQLWAAPNHVSAAAAV